MAEPILCPSCQTPLSVPADFQLAWLTCPRCLAVVANPAAQAVTQETPATPAAVRSPVRRAAEGETRPTELCPACGKPTQSQWVFCPYCEEPLNSPFGGVDARVRRDTRRTGVGMVLLAVLGGLGIGYALLGGGAMLVQEGDPSLFLGVLVGLVVLAGVVTLFTLARSRGDFKARGVGRIFLGTLKLAGALIAIGGILTVAAVVFIFAVCALGGGPRF
jgi:hypothetical protein